MKFINPSEHFSAASIPAWLLRRTDVTAGAKIVYARLCFHARSTGLAWPKIETLVADTGISRSTLYRFLDELTAFGLIHREQRGLQQSNVYAFVDHPWMHENKPTQDSISGLPDVPDVELPDVPPTGRQDVSPTGHEVLNRKKSSSKKKLYEANPQISPPSLGQVTEYAKHLRLPPAQAELFLAHHSSKGWRSGRYNHPIVDWMQAMVTWKGNYVKDGGKLLPMEVPKGKFQVDMMEEYFAIHGRPEMPEPIDQEKIQRMLSGGAK